MKRRLRPVAAHLAAVSLVLLPVRARAQDRLVRAEMEVDIRAPAAPVSVRILYVVAPAIGTDTVPLAALRFGDTMLEATQARVAGAAIDLRLHEPGTGRITAAVPLPAAAGAEIPVEVSYTVRNAADEGSGRVTVPVLALLWPPVEALPGTFTAAVRLPPGYAARDRLPSLLRETGAADGRRRYEGGLQVVPALISLRLTTGRSPVITSTTVIDVIAVLLLLVVGWVGWRRFRTLS